jgi:hypothetical protein
MKLTLIVVWVLRLLLATLFASLGGLPLPLLKFSGGSVTFYATFSTDTAMPSC